MKRAALTFAGGAGSVTGSEFLLELPRGSERIRVLVDCGLYQGSRFCEDENRAPFSYDPRSVGFLLVTHAHLDHIGRIPKLVREGFRGPIYSTPATRDLAELSLLDGVEIMREEARAAGLPPLYEVADVAEAVKLWRGVGYGAATGLPGGASFTLRNSGHILGSAMVEILAEGSRFLFTGDLGDPTPLVPPADSVRDIAYLVMESVYGDRLHEDREERRELLRKAVAGAAERGGALLIPSFSLERTQLLLYELHALREAGRIPDLPVFLDSPLAIKTTTIYRAHRKSFPEAARRESGFHDLFSFPGLRMTERAEESFAIDRVPNPKIIIAGSGMSNGGRILRHEARYLPDPRSTLLLVGYQAPGSRGRLLLEGAREIEVDGETIPVRAAVASIRGYSAHRDSAGLLSFVEPLAPSLKKVFLAMGEPKAASFLAQRLRDYLGLEARVPERGERVELPL